MKNVLVTGAAGFIGSNMVDFLSRDHNVYCIDNFSTGKMENLEGSAFRSISELNLADSDLIGHVEGLLNTWEIDTVYHFAALPNVLQSVEQTSLTHAHTLTSTLNLLEAMKNTKAKRIIFSSTSAIYGNCTEYPTKETTQIDPLTPYALQKSMCEQYLKMYSELHGISVVCLRNFNVFGPRMTNEGAYKSVISVFNEQKTNNMNLTITNDGEQRRDFVYVGDVVSANHLCGIIDTGKFEIFNVGYGDNFSVNEIADCVGGNKVYIGNRVESRITLCDNTKIKNALGWNPTVNVLDWIKGQYLTL